MRHTHTLVELGLSVPAFKEIEKKLLEADYSHAFLSETLIDMTGIAVTPETPCEELQGRYPIVLYFKDKKEAHGFVALVKEAKPNLIERALS